MFNLLLLRRVTSRVRQWLPRPSKLICLQVWNKRVVAIVRRVDAWNCKPPWYITTHLFWRYCECFAALRYCSSCNCSDCNNCLEFETVNFPLISVLISCQIRQDAIQLTRERNPSAFQMKVNVKRGHMAGCNCKKSRCLKKYCECFEGSVFCGPNCKCVDCQNLAGSEVSSTFHPIWL